MKIRKIRLNILIGLAVILSLEGRGYAQGTGFTYQGRLNSSGNAATGSYDFRFKVFLDSFGNTQAGGTLLTNGVLVTNGLFTVAIDFGAGIFNGTSYWLEAGVRTNGGGSYTSLAPLQALTPSPYAIFATSASSAVTATTATTSTTATTATTAGAVGANGVNSVAIQNNAVTGAKVAGGQVVKSLTAGANTLYDNVTLAAGDNVTITPSGQTVTIAATSGQSWALTGNGGTTPGTQFIGTTDNQAVELHVNGQRALRLEPNSTSPNVIGGCSGNSVGGGTWGQTIAGGGAAGLLNQASGNAATVGGGASNVVQSSTATIAGGYVNTIGSSSGGSSIGGGEGNFIQSIYGTIPGGYGNSVTGPYSFAAGKNASASGFGSFVWSDGNAATSSTGDHQFVARSSGGFFFYTGTGSAGAQLAPGATAWSVLSDRNAKKNFAPVDSEAVLEKLAGVPVERWNYKWESDGTVPHIGPMAQEFKRAFYPGRDDKSISTLEFDGVEIAAIQGLNRKLQDKDAEIQVLKGRLDKLERALSSAVANH